MNSFQTHAACYRPASSRMNRFGVLVITLAVFVVATVLPETATAQEWPLEIKGEEGTLVIYQPQVESLDGDILEARAAVSVRTKKMECPTYGAVWFKSWISTDRDERIVTLIDVEVTAVKFPESGEITVEALTVFIKKELPEWEFNISLDNLLAELELAEKQRTIDENFNNEPPKIYFATEPTVLVMIDGSPILREVEGAEELQYVVNTPFFIILETKKKTYYLKGGEFWYSSKEITEGWREEKNPPRLVVELAKQSEEAAKEQGLGMAEESQEEEAPAVAPELIVSTEPAELILADGPPSYNPLEGTDLLYMKNTESDVIMDIESQRYYVLLAGRWYTSRSLDKGKWKHVPADELPEEFPKIPAESDMGNVRVSIAGTQEAREAVLDNSIPQTAEVDRKTATVTVEYDGEPKFERCGDTGVAYAVNTGKSVLLIDGRYYCCDEAVWFESAGPAGPWAVCVEVPAEVQELPPDCPLYNVKYVYVYDSTPEVVYVGYTPAYYGSYVYHGCVVYGTGWWYHPWYHYYYYYPRQVTYGFGGHWNPYTGWGFSYGVGFGWLHVGVGWHRPYWGGWWGPAGYRYGYRHGYHRGYHRGYHTGYAAGRHAAYRDAYRRQYASSNIYKRRGIGVVRTQDRQRATTADRQMTRDRATTSQRKNNVYTDRSGNVYRRTDRGWEKRDQRGWSSTGQRDRASTDRSRRDRSRSDLDRQAQARNKGNRQANKRRSVERDTRQKSSSQQRTRSYNSGQRSTRKKSGGQRSSRSKGSGRRR